MQRTRTNNAATANLRTLTDMSSSTDIIRVGVGVVGLVLEVAIVCLPVLVLLPVSDSY